MRTSTTNTGRPAYYTIRKAAWILGVDSSEVCRAIRLGTLRATHHNGHLVIPSGALVKLLGAPIGGAP